MRLPHLVIGFVASFGKLCGAATISPNDIFITQVADPGDVYQARFVQVHALSANEGDIIGGDDLYLKISSNSNNYFNNEVKISGETFGPDGFFIVCNSGFSTSFPSDTCDLQSSGTRTIEGNGNDAYGLALGSGTGSGNDGTIIDLFGPMGDDTNFFMDSQAERNVAGPSVSFDISEWTIDAADVADITPRSWTLEDKTPAPTESSAPTPSLLTCTPMPEHQDLESHSRIEALDVFFQTHPSLTTAQRHRFVQNIGLMKREGRNHSNVIKDMEDLCDHTVHHPVYETLIDQGICNSDHDRPHITLKAAAPPAVSAKDAMKAAIEATKGAVKFMKDLTDSVVNEANEAMKGIDAWGSEIEGIKQEELSKYVQKVAAATVDLNSAEIQARNLYKSMKTLLSISIHDIESHQKDEEKLKVAIGNSQLTMSVQLEQAVKTLTALEKTVKSAAETFTVAAKQSASFSKTIQDNLNNKNGFIDGKAHSLRAKAYGGCAACAVFPPTCPVCYATAAGVVETKINEMKEHLKSVKAKLNAVKSQFDNLETDCQEFAKRALTDFEQMNDVSGQLDTTHSLVVVTDDVNFWTGIILPDMKETVNLLTTYLEKK